MGWHFPRGVPENTLFPRCVVTNVSIHECVCVCCGRGGGCVCVFWGSYGCSMRCPASSAPLYPKSHFVILATAAPAPGGGWCVCEVGRGDSPTTQHHPPRVPTSGGAAQPTRGGHGGDGAQPLCQVGNTVTFVHPTELPPPPLLFLARSLSLMHVRERGP